MCEIYGIAVYGYDVDACMHNVEVCMYVCMHLFKKGRRRRRRRRKDCDRYMPHMVPFLVSSQFSRFLCKTRRRLL